MVLTEGGVDDHLVALARGGDGGEEDAGDVRGHHDLHHNRHRDAVLVEAVLVAVGDRLRVPEARPAVAHRRDHRLRARHVEERLLLPGEAEPGEVLGRGAAPHGDRWLARQRGVRRRDLGGRRLRERVVREEREDVLGGGLEARAPRYDGGPGQLQDRVLQPVLLDEAAVRFRRHEEAAWAQDGATL